MRESGELEAVLPHEFKIDLIDKDMVAEEKKTAKKIQKIDDGIEAQRKVMEISGPAWKSLMDQCGQKGILTLKETGVLQIAAQIPQKIPSEKQSAILVEILDKAQQEGIAVNR